MYEDWFVLEFPPVQQESTLSLFSKEASQHVTDVLMKEISNFIEKVSKSEHALPLFETEEQLSWIMQVISYATTLSYTSSNEYESLHTAVRTYITWCSVLTKDSHPSVPLPLRADPERYTREMICALRGIFMKRNHGKKTDFPMLHKTSLDVDICTKRQAQEIQAILRGITSLTMNCSEKHRNFVQNVSLQFLLNSSDLLLSGQTVEGDISSVMAMEVVQTVFDEFLRSSLLEQIPSPSYWKTLSVLCRRWRHQVPLVENWARKVLSLSVLIVQELFGPDYLDIPSNNKETLDFRSLINASNGNNTTAFDVLTSSSSKVDISNDNQQSSLHLCWFQMLHLLGNPANIIDFDPCKDGAISHNFVEALLASGGHMDESGRAVVKMDNEELTPYTIGQIRQCFFLACSMVFKLVNIFYGDPQVSIEFQESRNLMKQWDEASRHVNDTWLRRRQRNSNCSVSPSGEATLTSNQLPPSGSVTGGSNILKSAFGIQSGSHSVKSKVSSVSDRLTNSNHVSNSNFSTMSETPPELLKPTSGQFIWNYLKDNPMYPAFVGDRYPKVNSLLEMFMDWLVRSALVRSSRIPYSDGEFVFLIILYL